MEPHQTVVQKQHLCPLIPNNSSQDYGDTPANNTKSQRRTLTQEVMLSSMELTNTPATPRQLASRKFPIKLLCEIAGAVLDGETGEMMECSHLRISPLYREMWGKSSGNEIGRLSQGMPGQVDRKNTLFFIDKEKYHKIEEMM